MDSDSDGLSDCNDLCPNTPEGNEIDSDGCSVEPTEPVALNLKWNKVTENADGTECTDLAGYKIYYSTTPSGNKIFATQVPLNSPGFNIEAPSFFVTDYVNTEISPTYYFYVTAYDSEGNESLFSEPTIYP